jgi:hypothetical protein
VKSGFKQFRRIPSTADNRVGKKGGTGELETWDKREKMKLSQNSSAQSWSK